MTNADESVIDSETLQGLRELAGDDTSFLPQMIDLYLKTATEKFPVLEAHLSSGRLKEVASICHQLKSSSGNLGALTLGKYFEAVEMSALGGNAGGAAAEFAKAKGEFPRVEAALKKLRNPVA
jgi:HPt (histidine-containing phosphotransfer) domain-containing protein